MTHRDPRWFPLYRIAAVAAIMTLATIPLQVIVFMTSPPPETVTDWFALFNTSPVQGLLSLDLIYIVSQVFIALLLLAVYIVLRDDSPALSLAALVIGIFGLVIHTTSNPSFDMLMASQSYAAATVEAERNLFLAVGETLVIRWQGMAYTFGYMLGAVGILVMSLAMWRTETFSRLTAATGIVLGISWLVPPSFGTLGLIFSLISLIPTMLWLGLLARQLLQLAADNEIRTGQAIAASQAH